MRSSALPRLLTLERHRQRASSSGGFSVPMLMERTSQPVDEPMVVSTSKGAFIQTRRSREGTSRYAFFPCPIEEEPGVVPRLHDALSRLSVAAGWDNRTSTVEQALQRFARYGVAPSALVIPTELVASVCGENLSEEAIETAMLMQGHVALLGDLRVLVAPLSGPRALVTAAPPLLGVYTRVGDYLGLQLCNVRQNVVVVDEWPGSTTS